MKELVTEFNNRYDKLNEQLNDIRTRREKTPSLHLSSIDRAVLNDYFNLCAEEHLFNDLGYIDPKVWESWYNGMKIFAQDQCIQEAWKQEEKDSYYGFTFPDVSRAGRQEKYRSEEVHG